MKSQRFVVTGACVAALALCGPMTAFAASKAASPSPAASASPAASPAAAKTPRPISYHGTVASVDSAANSFTLSGKTARVIKVTDKATITKAGASATFADIANDEKISGSYWKQADGTLEAKTVTIGGKGDADSSTKKSKKSKKDATEEADASAKASPSPSASPKK